MKTVLIWVSDLILLFRLTEHPVELQLRVFLFYRFYYSGLLVLSSAWWRNTPAGIYQFSKVLRSRIESVAGVERFSYIFPPASCGRPSFTSRMDTVRSLILECKVELINVSRTPSSLRGRREHWKQPVLGFIILGISLLIIMRWYGDSYPDKIIILATGGSLM